MSVDHDFYNLKNPKPLTEEFLRERLSDSYEVSVSRTDEKGLVIGFSLVPKDKNVGIAKLEIFGHWGGELDPGENKNIFSYRTSPSIHSGIGDSRIILYKVYADVARRLDWVIDDPQYNKIAITPEKFETGEFRNWATQREPKKKWWKFW